MSKPAVKTKKKAKKNITSGFVYVNSTFNNTIITITDMQGNVVSWSSAGMMGFKGSRIGFEIKMIEDITPVPHNGCRPKKRRRV